MLFQIAILKPTHGHRHTHRTIINTKNKVLPQKDKKEDYTEDKMILGDPAQHFQLQWSQSASIC